jgi:flagellar L-ring protein precursor FlgH
MRRAALTSAVAALCLSAGGAKAENLYRNGSFPAMSGDQRAAAAGDLLTVVIFESAEAVNSAQASRRRSSDIGGRIGAGSLDEQAQLSFGGGFTGRGEIRRSERVVARITVHVAEVLANGDLALAGEQWLLVNGQRTRIGVRGRVRQADIDNDNEVLSSRIADAQIDYDGHGFVSRSARPGLINRIFGFLGLS